MGNYSSKLFSNQNEIDSKSKLQIPNESENFENNQYTPITTRRCLSVDPRSATIDILRTPIEVDSTPTGVGGRTASAIPKYFQPKPYLETDIDTVLGALPPEKELPDPRSPNVICHRTPIIVNTSSEYAGGFAKMNETPKINSAQNLIHNIDPRSPAINFDRTPIMKSKSLGNSQIFHSEVMECNTETLSSPMLYCETTIEHIPEVQVLPGIISKESLSFDKSLDTCIDIFNENSSKCGSNSDLSAEESDSEGQITIIPNVNALTKYSEALNIHDTTEKKLIKEFTNKNDYVTAVVEEPFIDFGAKTEKEKICVWRDPTLPIFSTESKTEIFKAPEDIIIEFDDEQFVVKSSDKLDAANEKKNENKTSNIIFGEKRKNKQHFNKDIRCMYDDIKEYNSNGAVVDDTQKNRAPLGNRSNHKSVILAQSPQLLRNKTHSTKSQQQENTPPCIKRGKTKNKSSSTKWDLNRTVVI